MSLKKIEIKGVQFIFLYKELIQYFKLEDPVHRAFAIHKGGA